VSNRSYLVTGGAGFIGSHIAHALVKRGDRVRILDDLSTGLLDNLAAVRSDVEIIEGDLRDPLGEEAHEVAPELVQRYPDRALLLATDRCAIYCRFCTRSRIVGSGGGPRSELRLMPALEYLRNHPEIRDLIISGGDPLAMSTTRIVRILQAVRCIPSVKSFEVPTALSSGAQKLGQPVPLSNLVVDEKRSRLHPAQAKVPLRDSCSNGLVNGRSVAS